MNWLLNRLREPSTWRGLVWLLTALGVSLSPDAWAHITTIGMAAAGLIGVITREEPTQVEIQLPPIDLIAESQTVRIDDGLRRRASDRHPDPDGLPQQPVRPLSNTEEAADHDANFPGWGS